MADIKISELDPADQANVDDLLEASQVSGAGYVTKHISLDQVATTVAASEQITDVILEAIGELPPPVSDWDDITGKPTTFPPAAHTHPASEVSDFSEAVDDRVAGLLVAGTNTTIVYNDAANTLTVNSTAAPVSIPAASVAYGDAGGNVTGVLANMAFLAADKKFGVGIAAPTASIHAVSTTANQGIFKGEGVSNSTATQRWFHIAVADPVGGSGSSFRIDGGATGTLALYDIDRSGDALVSGWQRILSQTALAAGGRYYMGLYIGNGVGGNVGVYAGTGAPTLDTFGAYGSLYMDASTPGLPYYNSNGTTGWTRLAPITHVGTTAPSPAIDNALWFNSDASVGGGQLYVRYNDGSSTAWVPTSSGVGSTVLQTVSFQTGALIATAPGYIPWDDTIPQQTEGNEYMILAITPKSASSRLEIDVLFTYACGASNVVTIALFRDAAADALVATSGWTSAPDITNELKLTHVVASGSTASTTFKVRGGPTTGGPGITVNGVAGARKLGGVSNTAIVIREVL